MPRVLLIAVDSLLSFTNPNVVTEDMQQAFENTTTFAQAAARAVNRDPNTEQYFNTMTHEYQQLGWNIMESNKLDFQTSQNRIEPARVITSLINPYLSREEQEQLQGILQAMQQPDTRIRDFLSFWWSSASVSQNVTHLGIGPLTARQGRPECTVLYYTFNFTATSWRALFVERSTADLRVGVRHLRQRLNMSLYERIEDQLLERLGGAVEEHVEETPLDL